MKKNIQQLILEELKKIRLILQKDKVIDKIDNSLIKLEMKSYMTAEYLFNECQKIFNIYSYIDLSNITSERKGDYTIYFKNNQEADEENKNLSANDLKGKETITLEETLLLGIEYFKKTGNYLDINNITLCAGSRDSDGIVPCCYFSGGEFHVDWYDPDDRRDCLRARSAVKIIK